MINRRHQIEYDGTIYSSKQVMCNQLGLRYATFCSYISRQGLTLEEATAKCIATRDQKAAYQKRGARTWSRYLLATIADCTRQHEYCNVRMLMEFEPVLQDKGYHAIHQELMRLTRRGLVVQKRHDDSDAVWFKAVSGGATAKPKAIPARRADPAGCEHITRSLVRIDSPLQQLLLQDSWGWKQGMALGRFPR